MGLVVYTTSGNRSMIDLFKSLPYRVKTSVEDEVLRLSCMFDELRDGLI